MASKLLVNHPPTTPDALRKQLGQCMQLHRQRFAQRLNKIGNTNGRAQQRLLEELAGQLQASIAQVTQRGEQQPRCAYPEELPICEAREQISAAIKQHQVVIVCGDTGSGKTTQLPKICLDAGRGRRGLIGHTQPRRIAARAVAQRIAEELNTTIGEQVGYKVRFNDQVGDRAYIKLMTDGVLLAETQTDRYLNRYDTLIIDEAHERGLNIDFILGYLKQLLPKRRDLKVIITSATIDPQRFSKQFDNAPIIEVSGRSYPVEVRYRPMFDSDNEDGDGHESDLQQAIINALDELSRIDRGDTLVFLSGEREIRDTAEALKKQHLDNTEILPLLARLSNQEQNRIFHPSGKRRIILATNVAETSLTVPGIRYVIDAGSARISRYSYRSKIQRLPIEKISQASAKQRAGRCGRLSAGICIRLYSEEDYLSRNPFCEAEILRTNLAAVILNMESLRLGHVEQFPFLEPPDKRLISDGYKLLFELGAIDTKQQLTKLGKQLARLPLDPRLGRMLLAAADEGALRELLVIVAALSIQDPRDRPLDKQQAADEKQRHFRDPRSDFMAYLNIWHAWQQQRQQSSHNQQRRWCRDQFLAYMRMREWQDTHSQIEQAINQLKLHINAQPADYDAIHRALLCGLLGQIGFKDDAQCYSGARNRKFYLFPGSGLFQKRSHRQQKQESDQNSGKAPDKKERRTTAPKWLMAAELVETSKLYARTAAEISPQWVEEKATHLLKRSYSEPRWEKNAGQVRAFEKTTLYGLVINPRRTINYGPIAPQEAREIFIRGALVGGELRNPPGFLQQNLALIGELMALEAKSRRRDILVDEQVLYQFYDQRIPAEIYNVPLFEQWRKPAEKKQADILLLQRNDLMQHGADHITQHRFPDTLTVNGVSYPLEYHFDPSHQHDGVTLIAPLPLLSRLQPAYCDWLVPGLLHEKVVALIKSLPKQLRRNFVPAPDFADACLQALTPYQQPLAPSIAAHLRKITGITVPDEAWQAQPLDSHLLMNIRVIDGAGSTIAEGRNLQQLQAQVDTVASHCIGAAVEQSPQHSLEQKTVDAWDFDELPAAHEVTIHGVALTAYLALQQEGSRVALRVFDSHDKALAAQCHGVRQLIINLLPKTATSMRGTIDTLALYCVGLDSAENLKKDLLSAAINELSGDLIATNREQFQQLQNDIQTALSEKLLALCKLYEPILKSHQQLRKRLKKPRMQWLDSITDIHAQLDQLIYPHFIEHTPMLWLKQFPRYINAINKRLDKLEQAPRRDRSQRLEFAPLWDAYCTRAENPHHRNEALQHYRWMLEEFRVSLYAQELGTQLPVSKKRLNNYWKKEVLQQT